MKKLVTLTVAIIWFLATTSVFALPSFWYSAVAYNTLGQIITSPTQVEVSIIINDGSTIFTETFLGGSAVGADPFGIINVHIGTGTNSGNLSSVLMKSGTSINVKVRPVSTSTWVTIVGTALSSTYFNTYSYVIVSPGSIPLATNHILVGNGSGVAADVAMSGDASIASSGMLTLANSGVVAGTYPKVSVNSKGLVTSGTTLVAGDIPNLDWSKITTGKPTTLAGYGITDGVSTGGSYANPVWLTSLAWSKITGTPTTLAGYGITNGVTANAPIVGGTNTKITYDAKGLVTAGTSAVLASADYANQGTTTTVLHGNAAGNPSWGAVNLATDVTGTLPASSFPGLTGDVTSPAGSYVTTISNGVVTNAKLANVATATFKGRATAGTGSPEDLTVAQVNTLLSLSGTNTGDVTLGTANGLSLAGQVLSLGTASGSTTGALTSTDWTTFNNKQPAGNYITALTGDVTAAGPGSVAATIANNAVTYAKMQTMTANKLLGSGAIGTSVAEISLGSGLSFTGTTLSATGSGGTVTSVGLGTGTTGTDINVTGSPVTGSGVITLNIPTASSTNRGALSSADWTTFNNKQPAGNYITALTGDVTAAGPGSSAATITNGAVTNIKLANSAITINGTSVSLGGTRNLVLASADYVNQGTATTVLHGNVAGNPSWGPVNLATDVTGSLPASSFPGLTGDVTSPAGSYVTSIANGVVTNAKLANVATATFKGRTTAGTGSPEDLTVTQAKTLLNLTGTNTGDVTLGTANGLSLAGQVLSLGTASGSTTGALTSTDWTTFNNKQPAGNYITALTGDVTAAGPGSVAATIANNAVTYAKMQTMTANKLLGSGAIGTAVSEITLGTGLSFTGSTLNTVNNGTVTSVGLGTGTAGTDINVTGSPVTGSGVITLNIPTASSTNRGALSSADWTTFNNKQPAGNYMTALTGDVTAAGPGSSAATLATVNSNVGTFGSAANIAQFTVNGKGLITAASNVAIQIPETAVTNLTTDLSAKANLSGATFTGAISATNLSGTNTGDVTLGTANGLSLAGQVLSLGTASGSTTGALTSTDWTTFNNKQPAGSYITALTGDVTAAGPGSVAATIANNAVTYAKMQTMTANKLLGSGLSGTSVTEITLGAGLSFTGTTLSATGTGGSVTSLDVSGGTTGLTTTGGPISTSGTITLGGTLAVTNGGTGLTTTTAFGVITGGTTATGNLQNAGTGTSGQVLTSNGPSAMPTWQSPFVGGVVLKYTAIPVNIGAPPFVLTTAYDVFEFTGTIGANFAVTMPAHNAGTIIYIYNNTARNANLSSGGTIGAANGATLFCNGTAWFQLK